VALLDIIRLLNDENIYYEQVSVDDFQIKLKCPECLGDAKLWACIDKEVYFCHRCNWSPKDAESFVLRLTGKRGIPLLKCLNKYQIIKNLGEFEAHILGQLKTKERDRPSLARREPVGDLEFPEYSIELKDPLVQFHSQRVTRVYYKYLMNERKLLWKDIKDLRIHACDKGKYRGRLILPVFYRDKLMFWQAREAIGRERSVKYLTPKGHTPANCLFNIEKAAEYDYVIICEGFFSAIRAGEDAVATFGNKISIRQVELLKENGVKKVILCFDPDSWFYPKNLRKTSRNGKPPIYAACMRLLGHFDEVRVAILTEGDPDESGFQKTRELVQQSVRVDSDLELIMLIKEFGEI